MDSLEDSKINKIKNSISFINKEAIIYDIFIENAIIKKDIDSAIQAFLDILDYNQTILNLRTYNMLISTYDLFLQDTNLFNLFEVILIFLILNLIKNIIETHNLKNIGIMFCFSLYHAEKKNKAKFTYCIDWINDKFSQTKLEKEDSLINSALKIEIFESTYINAYLNKMLKNKEENSIDQYYYDHLMKVIDRDSIRKKIFHSSYSDILKHILDKNK